MTWLAALIPISLIIAATFAGRRRHWRRLGYVERVAGREPMPAMTAAERRERWRMAYDRLPIERQMETESAWPFAPTAVSGLHRGLRCDPALMLAGR